MTFTVKEQTSYETFFFTFPGGTRYHAERILAVEGGKMIVAFSDDGDPVGTLLYQHDRSANIIALCHIYTLPAFRRMGVATKLLEHVMNQHIPISARHILSDEASFAFDHFLRNIGFSVQCIADVFRCPPDAQALSKITDAWSPIVTRALQRGYSVNPFQDSAGSLISDLRRRIPERFPYGLDPFESKEKFDSEYSFIVVKDNIPVGYLTTFSQNSGQNLQLQLLAADKDYHNGKVAVLLMNALFTALLGVNGSVKDVRFTVFNKSTGMAKVLRNKTMTPVIKKRGDLMAYSY